MNTTAIAIIVVLLVIAFAGAPEVSAHRYGWGPSGFVGAVVLVLIILLLLGKI